MEGVSARAPEVRAAGASNLSDPHSSRLSVRRVDEAVSYNIRKIPDEIYRLLRGKGDERRAIASIRRAELTPYQMDRVLVVASLAGLSGVVRTFGGPDLPQRTKDLSGLLASGYGRTQIAEFWLDSGANIDARTAKFGNTWVHMSTRHRHADTTIMLGQRNADMEAADWMWGNRPLHTATLTNDGPTIDSVTRFKVNLDSRTTKRHFQTAWHLVALYNLQVAGQRLAELHANPNIGDILGRYPLNIARRMHHHKAARLIEQAGGEISEKVIIPAKRKRRYARWEARRINHYLAATGQ